MNYLTDKDFLKELDNLITKELFVKILVLDNEENLIKEIQGQASEGQINIDGESTVRRTGTLTFLPNPSEENLSDIKNIISINKKISLEIGYLNATTKYSTEEIIWFPMGVYIITEASFSQGIEGTSISISIQDKMCLLNGYRGGTIPAATTLSTVDTTVSGEIVIENVPIYNIIQEVVNHFGGEDLNRILISDVPLRIKQLVKWTGDNVLMLYSTPSGYLLSPDVLSQYTFVRVFETNQTVGYSYVDFYYPGELLIDAGQTVTDALDKIKELLGNYEYFYDVHGNFVFQEIKNYLNTSQSTYAITELSNESYQKDLSIYETSVYNFNDNKMIVSISNTPDYASVKNDFVVWGLKTLGTDQTVPIRYHLAIDKKPPPTQIINGVLEDWRNVLYRDGQNAAPLGLSSNYYYAELQNEWEKIYDPETLTWSSGAILDSSTIDYFLDFIDTNSDLAELSVNNIGRRSKVVVDNDVNCIFPPEIPDFIILQWHQSVDPAHPDYHIYKEYIDAKSQAYQSQAPYIEVNETTYLGFKMATMAKDAFSVVRDLLYQNTIIHSTINLQAIPIYHLDVNQRIGIYNNDSGIEGDYIIKSISLPLSISDNMSINALSALQRI